MRDDDAYRVHLNAGSGQDPEDSRPGSQGPLPVPDGPFCLGILGDFSGREGRRETPTEPGLDARPLIRVTPENVLQLGGLSPRVRIGRGEGDSGPEEIAFSDMEDFRPDGLFRRVAALERYRRARERHLGQGARTRYEAENEPETEPGPEESPEGASPPEAPAVAPPDAGFLDAVLDETREELAAGADGLDEDLDGFIRRVVRPHRVESERGRTQEVAALDEEISETLSQLLHEPAFQRLESLWRSVIFLLSRIEVKSTLRVYLIDISKSDLISDLLSSDDPTDWSLGSLVLGPVSEHGEELRWAGLVGAYTFGSEDEDIPLLQRIGLLAEAAEVPWFSAGDPVLLGCDSMEAALEPREWTDPVDPRWAQLRGNPEASWISLAFPGFLLRTPYGTQGKGAKSFDFTEAVTGPTDLLWGNPAILCGIAMARAFTAFEGRIRSIQPFTAENLPVFETEKGWASPLRGLLSHSAAARMRESGFTPVLGGRNEAVLRLQGVRTISSGENTIRAWWMEAS